MSASPVAPEVIAVLEAAELDGPALRLVGPQLERSLYVAVNRVLEAAGGKWNKKARAHLFEGEAVDAIEPILSTGEVVDAKKLHGFFETPRPVVDALLSLAGIGRGHLALEPSAGRGAIALPMKAAGADVMCIEVQDKNCEALRSAGFADHQVVAADFLSLDLNGAAFDRVAMNPPFAKQADIHHVLKAAKLLRPGGRLASVMSAGTKFRGNQLAQNFRQFVSERGGQFHDLPPDSFRESGTGVNAVIVTIPSRMGD